MYQWPRHIADARITHDWWATLQDCWRKNHSDLDWNDYLRQLIAGGVRSLAELNEDAAHTLITDMASDIADKGQVTISAVFDAATEEGLAVYYPHHVYRPKVVASCLRIGYNQYCPN